MAAREKAEAADATPKHRHTKKRAPSPEPPKTAAAAAPAEAGNETARSSKKAKKGIQEEQWSHDRQPDPPQQGWCLALHNVGLSFRMASNLDRVRVHETTLLQVELLHVPLFFEASKKQQA